MVMSSLALRSAAMSFLAWSAYIWALATVRYLRGHGLDGGMGVSEYGYPL